ncbi:isoprenoid synthase domain-containing protein-like X3, partial [Biomphalaria pfeifferi]
YEIYESTHFCKFFKNNSQEYLASTFPISSETVCKDNLIFYTHFLTIYHC